MTGEKINSPLTSTIVRYSCIGFEMLEMEIADVLKPPKGKHVKMNRGYIA